MKAVVLLSGGIDSAAALYWSIDRRWTTYALTVDYELEQSPELLSAERLAKRAGVKGHFLAELPFYKRLGGSPSSHRGRIVDSEKGISRAYVPARNIVFFGMGAAYAETLGATKVVTGHNRGDSERFPDASGRFFGAFNGLLRLGLKTGEGAGRIEVIAPFVECSKAEVLREAIKLGVPLEVTWSCYNNGVRPCGVCYGCRARREAFDELGAKDPLQMK